MIPIVIAKFGGSALGVNGTLIERIMYRIKQLKEKTKVLAVFSAPLVNYQGKVISMTDVAMRVGRSYASSKPVEIEVLREIYDRIASEHISGELSEKFFSDLDKFFRQVIISLKQAAENRRFVDVIRSRVLAYSGEIPMSYLMDYIMRNQGMTSDHVSIEKWPIITDDNFEAANFLVEESKMNDSHFIDLVERNEIVCLGGFIGKTVDGLETTYERGGSDRTAADTAILLNERYDVKVDFEKDCAVLSADPKIVKNGLESIRYLSYNEAKLAGMFGMKILDPAAIKEILDNNLDIPIAITNMNDPSDTTIIERQPIDRNIIGDNLVKIITGKKNCAIARIESIAASHLIASLEKDKRYHDFVKLSPYWQNDIEISRLLFLDADYVRKEEYHFKAYYPKVEIVYGRGVVTLIGDMMWKVPNIVSAASNLVGEHGINILNLDAQEETSRILIVVEDKNTNVADAVVAIHSKRAKIQTSKTKNE